MQVIFHTGAHHTDDERLLKCLLRNKDDFAKRGVSVPGPSKYRTLLKEAFKALQTNEPSPEARDVLIDAILDEEMADRLILCNAHFFGSQRHSIVAGALYPDAAQRISNLRKLFAFDQIEMFMAIRNPATFLPAVLGKAPERKIREAMGDKDPREIRWSEMLLRIREVAPDIPITIWCNEDTPLIWGQVVRDLAGLEHGEKIIGGFDLLAEIMSKEGMKRFRAYLHTHKDMSEMQKRRVIGAFLDKFALEDAVEEELDLAGWTDELVDEMTEIYDEDVLTIQGIPGVQVISP
ncbi:MAG: hypothetical protein ACI8R4_002019 [Paracoccaceae bacterium]|jgi:hypothetical protein